MDDNHHERRSQLIAALMTAEKMDYADAERVVGAFERAAICPRCGGPVVDEANCLSGTIWSANSR